MPAKPDPELHDTAPLLLTPKQAAGLLTISERQLRDLTDDGAIGFVNIGLGSKRPTRRYEPAEIERFIGDRRTVKAPAALYRPSRASGARLAPQGANALEELQALLDQRTRAGKANK